MTACQSNAAQHVAKIQQLEQDVEKANSCAAGFEDALKSLQAKLDELQAAHQKVIKQVLEDEERHASLVEHNKSLEERCEATMDTNKFLADKITQKDDIIADREEQIDSLVTRVQDLKAQARVLTADGSIVFEKDPTHGVLPNSSRRTHF